MNSKVNLVLVGAFVLILSLLMIFLGFWLFTQGQNQIYKPYLIYAQGGVDGLTAKSPVQFNGVRVGYVDSIDLSPKNPQFVKIVLQIDETVPITKSTSATLVPQGITGLVYVGLEAGDTLSNIPLKKLPNEDYPVIHYREPLMAQIGQTLPDITKNIQSVTRSFTQVFNDKNNQALGKILENTAKISQTLANNSQEISKSMESMDKILANTAKASAGLDEALNSINKAGLGVSDTMLRSQVFLNNMNSQLFPNVYKLVQQLQQAAANLQQFSSEAAQNPAIIIRGKKTDKDNSTW